jgi:glycosyltransferase involved in cell wall biosynthesis
MSSSELISVLLPVRNGGHYLAVAVASILQQSHRNLELIVVDDHCSDGAVDTLPADSRMRCVKNHGQGVSAAMATAMTLAKGQFIARMDADDIAGPARLATQLAYLQGNHDIGLCGAEVEIFSDQAEVGGGYQRYQSWINGLHKPDDIAAAMFIESPIPNPTVMFRREVYEQLGGFADPSWHEDYDLYLRAHFAGIRMGKPEACLLRWRDHDLRSTRNQPRYLEKQLVACKAHYLAKYVLSGRTAVICGTGPVALALHDALVLEGAEVSAFVDVAPRQPGRAKRGKPVLAYEAVEVGSDAFYLGALGTPTARQALQDFFDQQGMRVWEDYLLCA